MISDLNNEEILDFLMNSEFEGDYKPEELKYLLTKWRYFYRLLSGKHDLLKVNKEGDKVRLFDEISSLKYIIKNLQIDNAKLKDEIGNSKSKKLTWKERISGKIISNK